MSKEKRDLRTDSKHIGGIIPIIQFDLGKPEIIQVELEDVVRGRVLQAALHSHHYLDPSGRKWMDGCDSPDEHVEAASKNMLASKTSQ